MDGNLDSAAVLTDISIYWGRQAIATLHQRHLVSGYPDGTFRPNQALSRAEFAAIAYRLFSPILSPELAPSAGNDPLSTVNFDVTFDDVPPEHWAYPTICWGVSQGVFAGYGNGTFQPHIPITRVQSLMVLVAGLRLGKAPSGPGLLEVLFADADEIPNYAREATTIASQNRLVVNYPNLWQLRPNAPITRGEMAGFVVQALQIPDGVPPQYIVGKFWLADLVAGQTIALNRLNDYPGLVYQIQTQLRQLGLYLDGIDGLFGARTEAAIAQFCQFAQLPTPQILDAPFATALLSTSTADLKLARGRDRPAVFQFFLAQERGRSPGNLAFLDRQVDQSPYRDQMIAFPDRLKEVPDGQEVISHPLLQHGSLQPYPNRGDRPTIDESALEFLHPDIQQACVCIATRVDGQLHTYWLGRQAMKPIELWSTTKLVPILNVLSQSNSQFPAIDIDDCQIRQRGTAGGFSVHELAKDIMNYRHKIGTSNAIAAMLKQFTTPIGLEQWLQSITGHTQLIFRGRYGELPFFSQPELWHPPTGQVLLSGRPITQWQDNTLATYDLTRLVSMVGWHLHLPQSARLPGIQWHSLESVVRAMGHDSARYLDGAIAHLGLDTVIRSPVILSKLGNGRSSIRDRAEIAYTALLQWVDKRPNAVGKPAILHSMAMTLLAAKDYGDYQREATELDARMAAEVTELVRRLVQNEWD